jgi:hypothetical protein
VTDASADNHPALAGRGPEARRLADAVRRLIDLTVTNDAPPDATASIAAELEAVADRLALHLPEQPFPRFMMRGLPEEEEEGITDSDDGKPPIGGHMPYDPVVGAFNPLALPVALEFEPPKAIMRARFTTPYEGAPGCVHGSVLLATFDIVLTAANALAQAMGPTVRLACRFRRPTLLFEEAVFEGWVTEVTERRVHSLGRIVQNGIVTVEAEGEFAIIDPAGIEAMARRRREEAERVTDAS